MKYHVDECGILCLDEETISPAQACHELNRLSSLHETMFYTEYHFQNVEDVGVAFDDTRIWVCLNGQSLLRARWMHGKLFVEYNKVDLK